jgi:hypothetical protein
MKLNRLIMVSLVGLSLSTPAWACEPSSWGGIFSFFHHSDCDHGKDSHQDQSKDHDKGGSHQDCSGSGHSSGSSGSGSSGGSSSTGPSKGTP